MRLPKPKKTTLSQSDYAYNYLTKKLKFQYLSSGAFASVYGKKDHKRVFKIGHIDDNYLEYVKLVGLRNKNPHLPTIYSVKLFKYGHDWGTETYYVIEMERLLPFDKVGRRKGLKEHKRYQQQLGIVYIQDMEDPMRSMKPSTRHGKQLQKVLDKALDEGSPDMHSGNIMWRKHGKSYQLVVTDPVA